MNIEVLNTLQQHYNVLVLWHKSNPDNKRVFITKSFIPIQPAYSYMDLFAKEITWILDDVSFFGQFSLGRQTGASNTEFQKAQFDTKIEDIPVRHYQFSPDYSWEWYLAS